MGKGVGGCGGRTTKTCSSFISPSRRSGSDVLVLVHYFVFNYLKVDFPYVTVATLVPLLRLSLHKQSNFLPILRQGSDKIRFRENALNAVKKVSMFAGR